MYKIKMRQVQMIKMRQVQMVKMRQVQMVKMREVQMVKMRQVQMVVHSRDIGSPAQSAVTNEAQEGLVKWKIQSF